MDEQTDKARAAVALLNKATANLQGTRADHAMVSAAVATLTAYIDAHEPTPEPEQTTEESE